jgi:hypothetical protein
MSHSDGGETGRNETPSVMLEPEAVLLIQNWLNGGSALPAVKRLMDTGNVLEAAATARAAIAEHECADREALESLILQASDIGDEWIAALREFAKAPSIERWDELLTFVPEEMFYQRIRTTTMLLMQMNCEANTLFRCVTKYGMIPDVFDLVQTGRVDPDVIIARGDESPARAMWLGLAAQAAFARGDRWNTIKLLRQAAREPEPVLAMASMSLIRETADDEMKREIDKLTSAS